MNSLESRTGLPDALRVLVTQYPRDIWESHRNFDGLTRFWMERHLMFRDLNARATALCAAHLDGQMDPRDFGGQMAQTLGTLLNQLHGHHQIEDVHYFPRLATLDARLSPGFALLDTDHHALDGHIHALADSANAALRALRDGPARTEATALAANLQRFESVLDRHLTDEEDLVIPTILHFAAEL